MLVKFHLAQGNTVSLHTLDRKGNDTGNVADAIKRFHEIIGRDVPFVLAGAVKPAPSGKAKEATQAALASHVAEGSVKAAGGASKGVVGATESQAEVIDLRIARTKRVEALASKAKPVLVDG